MRRSSLSQRTHKRGSVNLHRSTPAKIFPRLAYCESDSSSSLDLCQTVGFRESSPQYRLVSSVAAQGLKLGILEGVCILWTFGRSINRKWSEGLRHIQSQPYVRAKLDVPTNLVDLFKKFDCQETSSNFFRRDNVILSLLRPHRHEELKWSVLGMDTPLFDSRQHDLWQRCKLASPHIVFIHSPKISQACDR
jgi:hypothetical protein